ncbi:MAG TPA: TIGR03118 family protein [Desulfuromonadaceae bacterium]|nr:TIGR03118 family protein [Desulfuromonadaceae bacterium]
MAVTTVAAASIKTNYTEVDLVSDVVSNAAHLDPRLINPWGLVTRAGSEWVADNGASLITAYSSSCSPLGYAINIPGPGGPTTGTPTGLAYNNTRAFVLTNGQKRAAAILLTPTEDGTITAWNPHITGSNAVIVIDNSGASAIYKGIAIAHTTNGLIRLYAANFHAGLVEIYDDHFQPVGTFTDTNLPAGFAPFNIKNIRGKLFVTFALQDGSAEDDLPGPGNGFVDIFRPDGTLEQELISQGALNSPWGIAMATSMFGRFRNALLVGNFGDGKINAYNPANGAFLGDMTRANGSDMVIDGLWALEFGSYGRLYFTAGINGETDGLMGYIRVASSKDP